MITRLAIAFSLVALLTGGPAAAQSTEGDAARGETLARDNWCHRCHGDAGIADNPQVPHLAGQKSHYLSMQILYFQQEPPADGAEEPSSYRTHRSMGFNARRLGPQDAKDVAAYFAAQSCQQEDTWVDAPVPPAAVIGQCAPCHGETGISRFDQIPNLAGQSRAYLIAQLNRFGARHDPNSAIRPDERRHPIMEKIAAGLTPEEIDAVATHFANMDCR